MPEHEVPHLDRPIHVGLLLPDEPEQLPLQLPHVLRAALLLPQEVLEEVLVGVPRRLEDGDELVGLHGGALGAQQLVVVLVVVFLSRREREG